MTKEKAKHLAEIFNAYAEGKPIEVFLDCVWGEVPSDEYRFDVENESYRIKKEPTYRPFKSSEECFDEMRKHGVFGHLMFNGYSISVKAIRLSYIETEYCQFYFDTAFKHGITFHDGQPFGIKE